MQAVIQIQATTLQLCVGENEKLEEVAERKKSGDKKANQCPEIQKVSRRKVDSETEQRKGMNKRKMKKKV